MGDLFKGCLPFDFIASLPRKVALRLREIRLYQKKMREQQQQQSLAQSNPAGGIPKGAHPALSSTAIDELVSELS